MSGSTPFRLNQSSVMLALISAAFAGEAGAAAGKVDFAIGGATVSGTDGRARPLAKGSDLDTGDTIRTNDGRAQIRFTDGSFVSLQPNTDFSIKQYSFEGKTDGSERGFFALAKGAMRTVTGLIGRVNRNAYQIATPTATIGIRGTGGLIEIQPDGSTLVSGTSGIWTLSNPSGTLDVPAGTSAKAPAEPGTPPQQTSQGPSTGTQPPTTTQGTQYTQGNQTNPDGTAAGLPSIVPLVSGSGYTAAYAFDPGFCGPSGCFQVRYTQQYNATFDSSGKLTSLVLPGGTASMDQFQLGAGGSHADFGTDGILAWGRWVGPITVIGCSECGGSYTTGANQGFHYVVGMPTPVMPTSGSATYALLGASGPTYSDGSTGPGTVSGSLNVTFGGFATINANMNVAMPNGRGYALSGTTTTASSTFFMSPTVTGSGGACSCGCSSSAPGFFSGASAERVGVSYSISDSSLSGTKYVGGAAAFKKQ